MPTRPKKDELLKENQSLKEQLNEKDSEIERLKQEHQKSTENLKNEHEDKIKTKKEEKNNLQQQVDEKDRQLNDKELKKLAQAFDDQEGGYDASRKIWFYIVLTSFLILLVSVVASIYFATDFDFYGRLERYLVNIIILTFLVFALKQFSYYKKLVADYANRKTIAQSYHNIINSNNDADFQKKYIDKATDVLTAKSDVVEDSHTLPEQIIDKVSKN